LHTHGAELEDIGGHVYETASKHTSSCPNLSVLRRNEGEDSRSLQETVEYEVMLAARANPAYKIMQNPVAMTADAHNVSLAGIYEQLN
jgi:hypothetical protein